MQIQAHEQKSFLSWMRKTNNVFTGDEYHFRLGVWLTKKRMVQEHNAGQFGFKLALNHLSALTPSEYKSLLGFRMPNKVNKATPLQLKSVPTSWDWRDKGIVNPIKDQAQCGSCWAFSAIQAQESQWALIGNKLLSLSEQNIVDCVQTCDGCSGGLMTAAYDWVIENQGGQFMLEKDYPYTAMDGNCQWDSSKAVEKVTGYINVESGSETDLANKVYQYGPAAIAIDASCESFQEYSSGVYDEPYCSSDYLDHGVGCIGWGVDGSKKYWIIRNSWGTSWGIQGWIWMVKDKNNQCGEATMACIPTDK
jgi:cathepsin L